MDDETTDWKLYRVDFSHSPEHKGWCVFEITLENALVYIDGPWDSSDKAYLRMAELNLSQGVNLDEQGQD